MSEQEYIPNSVVEQDEPIDIGELVKQSFEEDDLLAHTQALRLEVIKKSRKVMSDVPAYAHIALSAADGIDRQIISKRKLGVISAAIEQNEMVKNVIRDVTSKINDNPFKNTTGTNINETMKDDSDLLPPPPSVPGIRDIGVSGMSYEDFMQEKGLLSTDGEET